jgi:hypothetical protein
VAVDAPDFQRLPNRSLRRATAIHISIAFPTRISKFYAASLAAFGIPTILKGWTMNARFLRDEAARFRDMAADTDRAASKVRLLAMAADYEARADVARELVEPPLGDEIKVLVEPSLGEALKAKPARKITLGLKGPVIA